MQQKDYLLREIEKIGLVLSAIRQKVFGGQHQFSINPEKQLDDVKNLLLNELDFELDTFLLLNNEELNNYISRFKGFNAENIECLAECISQIGFNYRFDTSKKYFEKALQLYEFSILKSKTYSYEKEQKMMAIKNALNVL